MREAFKPGRHYKAHWHGKSGKYTQHILTLLSEEWHRLPWQDRNIIKLRFHDALTFPQIAEKLGLSNIQSVRHKLMRAELALLKAEMGVEAEPDS